MKRKVVITLLIAILATMMSFCVWAAEVEENFDVMLISANEEENDILISPAPTSDIIKVQLDGKIVDFTDEQGNVVNPKIIQNRTMVPMRKIFEIFEAEINWNNETRTVTATTTEKEISLTINSEVAKLKDLTTNEEKEIELDAAPVLVDNRTMVPVRFIAESLEKQVGWDSEEKTVVIIDFAKLGKELEEKTPQLKNLMDLEIEPVESMKTTSKISGKIVYKDAEERANNETVKVEGNLDINMNQEKDMEMILNLKFTGKGTIYNSIKQAGYETMKFAMIIADSHTYMMVMQNGEEVWMDLGEQMNVEELKNLLAIQKYPKNHKEYLELISKSFGELNVTSYQTLQQTMQMFEFMFAGDKFEITKSGNIQTIKYTLDLKDIISSLIDVKSAIKEELDSFKMKIDIVEKVENKKVNSSKVTFSMFVEEPDTKESIEIELILDMQCKSINKDFDITLPEVEVMSVN